MAEHVFAGKTALVTGGSRGIGRAAALRLAAEGAHVAINYASNRQQADATLDELRALGIEAIAVPGDVSDRDAVARLVATVRDSLGPIDILIHAAGMSIVEHASDVTWESWRRTMDVNLDGTFHTV
ncbi:MAG: SDR family NAD(P)-dependent oxidoreductase, partial [Planctomycetaceae bacterium]|nr:SDR family NAD(P)-dependent oxidoreductase [Planctomycetaceae bacterium]